MAGELGWWKRLLIRGDDAVRHARLARDAAGQVSYRKVNDFFRAEAKAAGKPWTVDPARPQ